MRRGDEFLWGLEEHLLISPEYQARLQPTDDFFEALRVAVGSRRSSRR